jgi:hypothetical protein
MGVTGWGRGNVVINGAREARVADGQVAAETRHEGDKTMSHSRHRRFTGKRVGRGINLCPPRSPLLVFTSSSTKVCKLNQ